MTIPSQSAVWSFALQNGAFRDTNNDAYDNTELEFVKYRTPRVSLGTVQDQQNFPLEAGGTIVPTGAFKQMQAYAGDVDIFPRLENSIGLLLFAALGKVETTNNEDRYGNPVTGVHTHRFRFDDQSSFNIPWLSSRCLMPGRTPAEDFGEYGYDCKIGSLTLSIPQMGKMTTRVAMQGRKAGYDNDPQNWTYTNATFEDSESVPDAGRGFFLIGGESYPAMGATATLNNNLTNFQQEMIIGSFNPDDFIPLTRDATLQFVYKYENSQLFQQIVTGQTDGTDWNPLPFFSETDRSGANPVYALDMGFLSPENIPGTTTPYRMSVLAHKVTVAKDGMTQLQAGNIVTENYTLTVLEPAAGEPYFEIILENGIAKYDLPGSADPVLTFATTLAYSGLAVVLDGAATVTDVDSVDFYGGKVEVLLGGTNITADDSVDIVAGGNITRVSNSIYHNGTLIGSVIGDGQPGTPLVVTLNANATPAITTELLQVVTYNRIGGANAADVVTATVTVRDGDGGVATETVTITHS